MSVTAIDLFDSDLPQPTLQWWPTERPAQLRSRRLPDGRYVAGREPRCAIVFDELENPTASRVHAEFQVLAGRVQVIDLGSTNHTFVAGGPVSAAWLRHGERVTIGDFTLAVHYPPLNGKATPPRADPPAADNPSDFEPARTIADIHDRAARFRAELRKLYIEEQGDVGAPGKETIERRLARRMNCHPRTVHRRLLDLRAELPGLDKDLDGPGLVQGICEELFGPVN